MKKYLIIIAVLILLAVGYFGFKQYGSSNTSGNPVSETAKIAGDVVKGTIQDILSAGKSVTCTVAYDEKEIGGTGIIFVSGKKMAGDFKTTVEGKIIESHMITDGTYSYIWSSDQTEGIKMKIDEAKVTPGANGQVKNNDVFDLEKESNLKCSPWLIDNSKFNPPANIKFTDFTEMMKGFTQPTTSEKEATNQTSPCNQITDVAAKAACVEALSN